MNKKNILTLLLTAVLFSLFYYIFTSLFDSFNANQEIPTAAHTNTTSYGTLAAQTEKDLSGSREKLDGKEYVKINLAELNDICERNDSAKIGGRYVMRGYVFKSPELAKEGQFGLLRATKWCCAAHSFAYGFRVPAGNPDIPESGQWVKVYGKLQETDSQELDEKIITKTVPAYLMKKWVFVSDKIEKIDTPSDPNITLWCTKEPFTY